MQRMHTSTPPPCVCSNCLAPKKAAQYHSESSVEQWAPAFRKGFKQGDGADEGSARRTPGASETCIIQQPVHLRAAWVSHSFGHTLRDNFHALVNIAKGFGVQVRLTTFRCLDSFTDASGTCHYESMAVCPWMHPRNIIQYDAILIVRKYPASRRRTMRG